MRMVKMSIVMEDGDADDAEEDDADDAEGDDADDAE